jgi:hypothetical protein
MKIKTEEQYRRAVKRYLELSEFPAGTQEHDEAILLEKAMGIYEKSEVEDEKDEEILRKINQN